MASPAAAANAASIRKDLVREKLLDTAAELFSKRGYANTRIVDIAESMGLSRPALYHYFSSKDEVLAALTQELAASSAQRLETLLKDKTLTAAQRLRETVLGNVQAKLTGGPRFRMLDRIEAELPAELLQAFKKERRRVLNLTIAVIEEGIASGEFRPVDAKLAAFAIIGMANWTAWWYSPKGEKGPEEIAGAMVDLVLKGLSAREKGAAVKSGEHAIDTIRQALAVLERAVK